MLHQLPSGSWIALADVRCIDCKSDPLPHVQIGFADGTSRTVWFDYLQYAEDFRDALAIQVNEERKRFISKDKE